MLGVQRIVVERQDPGPADWLTGASVLFRADALRQTGLFDDGFFLYFEEVELMHRMGRGGWDLWTVPASRVTHIAGAATGVVSGLQQAVRPFPAYRYEARRRYFVRVGGIAGLMAANLAWLAGKAIAFPMSFSARRRAAAIPQEFSMTLRHSFWPSKKDARASIPNWDEPPGRAPAWTLK
jgi:GT2 family glycosyltransferase